MRRSLALTSLAVVPLASWLAFGCSTGTPPGDPQFEPDSGGSAGHAGAGGNGGAGAIGGRAAGGGAGVGAAAGVSGTGPMSGGAAGNAGQSTGGSAGSGVGGSAAGAGGTGAAGAGGTGGVGGTAAGNAGNGATGGTAGTAGMAGGSVGGMSGAAGATGGTGGAPAACPPDAIFCSGFEDAGLPAGATYLSSNDNNDASKGLVFDKTVFHGGAQSVEILKLGSYAQREVVVPAAKTFWFRAYLRTDVKIGDAGAELHNLFFEAAWVGGDKGIEIVEEDCMLGANIMDTRYGSNGTENQPGCPTSGEMGMRLPANEWHCFEGYFNGTSGDFQVYVNGDEALNLTGLAGVKHDFTTLRFGYRHYHERQRLVWYDDVVTAPTRIGCL